MARTMNTYLPMGMSPSGDVKDGIVGEIVSICGTEVPENFLVCDGSLYNKRDYQELVAFFDKYVQGGSRAFSANGDADDTFRVPNLTQEFIKGSVDNKLGVYEHAGLPDITGYHFGNRRPWFMGAQGAFYLSGNTDGADSDGGSGGSTVNFDASRSNAIYGRSDTVTPNNFSVLYCIRYQQTSISFPKLLSQSVKYSGVNLLQAENTDVAVVEDDEITLAQPWNQFDKMEIRYSLSNRPNDVYSYYINCLSRKCSTQVIGDDGNTIALLTTILVEDSLSNKIKFANLNVVDGADVILREVKGYRYKQDINLNSITGEIRCYAGKTLPDGWIACDGSEYDNGDEKYNKLFQVIGYRYGGSGSKFKVPDLTHRFVEGAETTSDIGKYKSAGLPNIYGQWGGNRMPWQQWAKGALSVSGGTDGCDRTSGTCPNTFTFRASDGEIMHHPTTGNIVYKKSDVVLNTYSVYGKSKTVQPPARLFMYIIAL